MDVSSGTQLGPYSVLSRIGAGGMGEVWKARDTRLDRSVAIKVLPAEFAENAQLRSRFEREAKAISQLNHPNICTLHDVGIDNDRSYLVMELLDGETLADRLARGPLPFSEVVRYGAQIASALDRAHRAGIVHRDLKPGNVMITRSGAKLLDFGLAKTTEVELEPDGATQQKPLTREGTILGTFQYMSPEQLEGADVDFRSDIFALGALLYEMATGHRAFEGKTKTSLIAAIVGGQPKPIAQLQPVSPAAFEHLVLKCLEKDPDERWQSAHDIASELTWIGSAQASVAATRPANRFVLPLLVLALIAATVTTLLYVRERSRPATAVSFDIQALPGYTLGHPQISPDGHLAVFLSRKIGGSDDVTIWARKIDEAQPRRLTETMFPNGARVFFFSPDGTQLAFFADNSLQKIDVTGGKPEVIARNIGYGVGGTWNEDGVILFNPRFSEPLYRIQAQGGEPVRVTSLDRKRGETMHGWPHFLADGEHFVFLVYRNGSLPNEIFAASLDGGPKKYLLTVDSIVGVGAGDLFFVRDGALYAQKLNERTLALEGDALKLADDVLYDSESSTSGASVARDGTVLFLPSSNALTPREIGWYDISGKLLEMLMDEQARVDTARVSFDETKIALARFDSRKGANDIWVHDVSRGVRSRVTSGRSNHRSAVFDPKGERLYFSSDRLGIFDIFSQHEDGTSPAELVWRSGEDKSVLDISPDGKYLLITIETATRRDDIWLFPLDRSEKPRALISTEAPDGPALFSPDGKWITYASLISGRSEAYVKPLNGGRAVQVSIDGGRGPEFSADGKKIFFGADRKIWMATLFDATGQLRPGKPVALFDLTGSWFATSRRDDRFLMGVPTRRGEAREVARYLAGWKGQRR